MPLTVETGAVVPGANSYVEVADADAYLALMGNTAWATMSAGEKESALAKGALIVDDGATYIYSGGRATAEQSMVWPRVGASYRGGGAPVPERTIPPDIKRAQIVAAGGIADGTIRWGSAAGGAPLLVQSETVDSLSVTYFAPKDVGSFGVGLGPLAGVGAPSVTAIVAPLLDEDSYGGTTADMAARRGPAWSAPSYGGVFDVGMHDTTDAPVQRGLPGYQV